MAAHASHLMLRVLWLRADTRDLIDRMAVVPSKKQRFNYNGLMRDLDRFGLKTVLLGLAVAGETEQQSLLDIIDPNTHPTNMGATFTPGQGFQGNGTSTYVKTGFNPSLKGVAQNSFAFGAYLLDNQSTGGSFGCSDVVSGMGCLCAPRNGSNVAAVRINANTTNNVAGATNSSGLVISHRSVSNTINFYRNGVSPGGGSQNSGGVPNEEIAMGAIGRTPVNTFNTFKYAGWVFAPGITAAQHLNLYIAKQRYYTELGIAV